MCAHWIGLDKDIDKEVRVRIALHPRIVEFVVYMVSEGKGFDRGFSWGTDCVTDAVEYSISIITCFHRVCLGSLLGTVSLLVVDTLIVVYDATFGTLVVVGRVLLYALRYLAFVVLFSTLTARSS